MILEGKRKKGTMKDLTFSAPAQYPTAAIHRTFYLAAIHRHIATGTSQKKKTTRKTNKQKKKKKPNYNKWNALLCKYPRQVKALRFLVAPKVTGQSLPGGQLLRVPQPRGRAGSALDERRGESAHPSGGCAGCAQRTCTLQKSKGGGKPAGASSGNGLSGEPGPRTRSWSCAQAAAPPSGEMVPRSPPCRRIMGQRQGWRSPVSSPEGSQQEVGSSEGTPALAEGSAVKAVSPSPGGLDSPRPAPLQHLPASFV